MEKIFKAKRIDNGEWVEFGLFNVALDLGKHFKQFKDNTVDIFVDNSPVCIDKNTISQYTGKNDSEDNRIFQGDELKAKGEIDSIAVWKNSSFCIKHKTIHSSFVKFSDIDLGCYTLTGHNIHDEGF